jgi:hypothetical protein
MELIISSVTLTFLLLIGGFVDFLVTASAPHAAYHGDAFAAEPKPIHDVEPPSHFVPEYDRAA